VVGLAQFGRRRNAERLHEVLHVEAVRAASACAFLQVAEKGSIRALP
jgi:hypothetical protein